MSDLGDIIDRGISSGPRIDFSDVEDLKRWMRAESKMLEVRRRRIRRAKKRRGDNGQARVKEWMRLKSAQLSELFQWSKKVKNISCMDSRKMRKEPPCQL